MNARASLWASLAIAASIGLAGCGGSSDKDSDDMMTNPGGTNPPAALPTGSLDLPTGHNLDSPDQGTETEFTVPANGMRTIGNVKFECKSNRACTVTVRNLLGQADATRVGEIEATLVAATDGGGPTTPTSGAGGTGTGSNAFLSRAMLLEAVEFNTDDTRIDPNKGIGSDFEARSTRPDPLAQGGSYQGIVFERKTATHDDIVHIRSDIAAAGTAAAFDESYGDLNGDDDKNDVVSSSDADDFWSLIGSDSNVVGGNAVQGVITTSSHVQGEEIDGVTFGLGTPIPGTLTCESGTCVVTNRGGELSAPGEWTFEADNQDGQVTPPDSDYLVFGYWLQTPQAAPTARPVVLEAFYAGSDPFEADNVVGLDGPATYTGPAVGRYAYRASTAGSSTSRDDFPAAASITLTANFGTDAQAGTISGSVTGIHTSITNVALPRTSISGAGTFSGGKPTGYTGGSWSGQFFGNTTDGDDDANPTSAAGMFEGWKGTASGSGEYISLEGSFGATVQ